MLDQTNFCKIVFTPPISFPLIHIKNDKINCRSQIYIDCIGTWIPAQRVKRQISVQTEPSSIL